MHLPTVSRELVQEVRTRGSIEQKEFARLILHWFPAMWSLLWTLTRRKVHKQHESLTSSEEPVTARIMKMFLQRDDDLSSRDNADGSPLVMQRVSVPDMVGDKGVSEIVAVMASDAMKACAEETHHVRLILEPNHYLIVLPHGIDHVCSEVVSPDIVRQLYPLAYLCIETLASITNSEKNRRSHGYIDVSSREEVRDQLMQCMAVRSYRLCLEDLFCVTFAFQWPGVLVCVPKASEESISLFRSAAQQILAVAEHQRLL